MLTVGAVHPSELLCNPSSPNVWFLWRSFVRDDPSGPDHFASTCLPPIDNLEYLHLFDVFLLFSFGLIDLSYRNASFVGVVSYHLVAFLVQAVFHQPIEVLDVQQPSFLHGSLQTAADVVNVRDD